MKNVAVYCRLSDEDTNKKNIADESESIQNQKSMLISYAMERGWSIYNIYSDEDYSGADRNRPGFNRMLADCENGKIDIVLCKTQSRFSRDMEIIEKYIHGKFLEWGIRFIGIIDNADTEIQGNKKSRQINGLINEWYLEDLSENIKRTVRHKKEKGEYTGSHAPYGYVKNPDDKHKFIIDPVAADIIKTIFNLYKNGIGYIKIAQYLDERNIPTPHNYKLQNGVNIGARKNLLLTDKWHPDTIRYMLKDEVYIGNLIQGKRRNISYKSNKTQSVPKDKWIIVKNTHEPIIDMETWNTLQERFCNVNRPQKHNGEVQVFSQKVFCDECGRVFRKKRTTNKNGKAFDYLVCKGRSNGDYSCSNIKAVPYDELENLIIDKINSLLDIYYNKEIFADEFNRKNSDLISKSETSLKIETLNKENKEAAALIFQKQKYFKVLYEDKIKGVISEDQFIRLNADYTDEIKRLENRIDILDKEINKYILEQKKHENINYVLQKYSHVDKLDKCILDEFIENIKIGCFEKNLKNRKITVQWNI